MSDTYVLNKIASAVEGLTEAVAGLTPHQDVAAMRAALDDMQRAMISMQSQINDLRRAQPPSRAACPHCAASPSIIMPKTEWEGLNSEKR